MTNMVLLIAVVALLLIMLALFIIVFMEFTARRAFEHYSMDLIKELYSEDSNQERTIPAPKKKDISNKKFIKKEQTSNKFDINEKSLEWKINRVLEKNYGQFNHQRLIDDMGLKSGEADELVLELIQQLEAAIKELEKYIKEQNFSAIAKLTHELKGAALNIGTGGIADILVDYNDEFKDSKNIEIANAYQKRLKEAISNLKIEYSQVA